MFKFREIKKIKPLDFFMVLLTAPVWVIGGLLLTVMESHKAEAVRRRTLKTLGWAK